jgi:serine/threonine protein kinase
VIRERDLSAESDNGEASDDAELGRVLEAYLADLEAGRPADPERLLAAHPAIARELRACLQVMNLADRMVNASSSASAVRRSVPRLDSTIVFRGHNFLTTLGSDVGTIPHVHLRDLPGEPEPLIQPRSAEMPAQDGATSGRYQLQGEIARGGMGAILKGRDVDLGRELALKVLLESHQRNPEIVSRFIEEAQIGGQLQHPGIAPVYELGTFPEPDHRPYFAMKLVRGQTLAALLRERTDRAHETARFLVIFEQVCQTMAYAHARGVIHRDLKPSNVMVGLFGEVQVMDRGLAKVLPRGGIADEAGAQPQEETVVMTVRSGSAGSGSDSQAGSILGTSAYMAPEQARGEVDRIDERADVFGLGAILCEILTGKPPFLGSTREEIRVQAARGDLTDALHRLGASTASAELIGLAHDCLAADRDRRPRNAGDVTRRLTAHLAGVQERLRLAELARVEAQAKAAEERKRRRLTVALAGSVLVTAGLIGGGWVYLARQKTARLMATTRLVTDALAEAERLRGQAQLAALGDRSKWSEAMAAARHARELLTQGETDHALRQRVANALAEFGREHVAAEERAAEYERDQKLLGDLETVRVSLIEHRNRKQTDLEYAATFRAFGIDFDQLDPTESGMRIGQRSRPVELAAYLDDWALYRRAVHEKKDETPWRRLLKAAQLADPNPWRMALRDQIGLNDPEALRRPAADVTALEALPASSLALFAHALVDIGDRDHAKQVLQLAWRQAPGDAWVNFNLANPSSTSMNFKKPQEAVRYLSVFVAIRPGSSLARAMLG